MDRLEAVRLAVDAILEQQPDSPERRCGYVHLYGVAAFAALLALRRGMDPGLAATAGMLHDIWSYRMGGPSKEHAIRSAKEARQILGAAGGYTHEEIAAVSQAIARHSRKAETGEPLDELLKDADVLQHHLYNPSLDSHVREGSRERLRRVLGEFGIDARLD